MAVDYAAFQSGQNPLQMAMQGFSDAGAIQQAQQQQQIGAQTLELNRMKVAEYQKAQAKQQEFQSALANLGDKPSLQDYENIMARFPQLGSAVKENYERLNTKQKQSALNSATQVLAALQGKNKDVAKSLLEKQALAAENVGDTAAADAARVMMQQIDMEPSAARNAAVLSVAAAAGPEQFASIYEKISQVGRENELQPGALAKQEVELMQLGTNMGVDPKTTQKMLASYRNAGVSQDTARNLFAIEAQNPTGRIYDPEKRYAASKDLRTEYNNRVGDVTAGRVNFQKMEESAKIQEGLGDVALITSFMKMLDPGSTVRESEFAVARDTGGLLTSLENLLTKAKGGQFLTNPQRTTFVNLAKQYLAAAEKDGAKTRKAMEGIVARLGLNPADVFTDGQDSSVLPMVTTAAEFAALPSGALYTEEDGQTYRKP
jgi:hypothetical protein